MSQFSIEIKGIPEIQAVLANIKGGAAKAICRALNKTVGNVESEAAKAVVKELNVAQATVKKDFKATKATYSQLYARVRSQGRPIPLSKTLRVRQVKKGVSVQVKLSRPRKILRHAFLATMPSGHRGVFWRSKTKRMRMNPKKWAIEERFGPRIPDIFSNTEVMDPILDHASEYLQKNLGHEVSFILESSR